MEGFECKKCGSEDVRLLDSEFGNIGKGITHIKCLNSECENFNKIIPLFKGGMKCPKCGKNSIEIDGRENVKGIGAKKGSWITWGICHNPKCRFFEQRIGI